MDVQVALGFVKNKWGNCNSLSDRDLNFKLVILLALTSASTAWIIQCLDISFMVRHAHFGQFMVGKLHKNWKSVKDYPVVRCYENEFDRGLCVETTLDVYLERTKPWETNQRKKLLLS